jgi:hypothetical protein
MLSKYIADRLLPLLWIISGVAALAALGYSLIPSAGERQFTRTAAALGRAQSYRMVVQRQGNEFKERWLLEVVCPDRQHSRQTEEPANPRWDSPRGVDIEHIDVGNRSYIKFFRDAEWKAMPLQGTTHCGTVPFLQDGSLFDFKHSRAFANIEEQGLDTVAGETCREWVITFRQPDSPSKIFDFCINSDDNLPRRMKTAEGSFQIILTNWNQPIDIQAPE